MPRICYFLGISVYMYWNEHQPPHFHAVYGDYAAMVSIETGTVIQGKLSKKVAQLVQEWTELHRQELLENWELAQVDKDLKKIMPLE